MDATGIKGIDDVMRNLNKEVAKIKHRTAAGLTLAAANILADCDRVSPTIPVDTGELRASRFVSPPMLIGNKTTIMFGFSANYAAAVHEMVGANFKRPGSGARFLEASLKRNVKSSLKIIRDNAKIK